MVVFKNIDGIDIVDSFLRLYGNIISGLFIDRDVVINIRNAELKGKNHYHDLMARINNDIFVSEKECGLIGLSEAEIFAALAHEIGHILYKADAFRPDSENIADQLAADLGLGSQMISVIEKIIESRRYPRLTSMLVQRIQYLGHIA